MTVRAVWWWSSEFEQMATVLYGDLGNSHLQTTVFMLYCRLWIDSYIGFLLRKCNVQWLVLFFLKPFYITFSHRCITEVPALWGLTLSWAKNNQASKLLVRPTQEEISLCGYAQSGGQECCVFRAWGSFVSLKRRQPVLLSCCLSCPCAHQAGGTFSPGLYAPAPFPVF